MSEHDAQRHDEDEARPDPQGRDRKDRLLREMHGEGSSGTTAPEPTDTTAG